MRKALGALLLLSSILAPPAQAQDILGISPGDRVRVTAPECDLKNEKGTFISFDADLFSATLDERDIECPVEALTRLEVSVGERKWWKWGLGGFGVGAGAGAATGMVVCAGEDDELCWALSLVLTGITASVGFVSGSVVGLIRGKDKWEEVPLPPVRPYLQGTPDGRFGIGFSIPVRW